MILQGETGSREDLYFKVLFRKADHLLTTCETQGVRVKPLYTCTSCHWSGDETHFMAKILSIMYRPKHDNIQAFKQIKCPKCHNLVTIIFETLDGSIVK